MVFFVRHYFFVCLTRQWCHQNFWLQLSRERIKIFKCGFFVCHYSSSWTKYQKIIFFVSLPLKFGVHVLEKGHFFWLKMTPNIKKEVREGSECWHYPEKNRFGKVKVLSGQSRSLAVLCILRYWFDSLK